MIKKYYSIRKSRRMIYVEGTGIKRASLGRKVKEECRARAQDDMADMENISLRTDWSNWRKHQTEMTCKERNRRQWTIDRAPFEELMRLT